MDTLTTPLPQLLVEKTANLNWIWFFRDNQTSEEHPDGIYHPHKDVQHIKKRNIGLIEVMGLAILPPRLKTELKDVEDYLLGQGNQVAPIHQEWADELKAQNPNVTAEEVTEVVRQSDCRYLCSCTRRCRCL